MKPGEVRSVVAEALTVARPLLFHTSAPFETVIPSSLIDVVDFINPDEYQIDGLVLTVTLRHRRPYCNGLLFRNKCWQLNDGVPFAPSVGATITILLGVKAGYHENTGSV